MATEAIRHLLNFYKQACGISSPAWHALRAGAIHWVTFGTSFTCRKCDTPGLQYRIARHPPQWDCVCFPQTAQDSGASTLITSRALLDNGPTGSRNDKLKDFSVDLRSRRSDGDTRCALRSNRRSKRCCSETVAFIVKTAPDATISCTHSKPRIGQ